MAVVAWVLLGGTGLAAAQGAAPGEGDEGPGTMREGEVGDEAARQHFEVGLTLFRIGRYGDAAREFEAAYHLSSRSVLLFNAYLAYRDAGDLPKAVETLRLFLQVEPNDPERDSLQVRLRAMEQSLERERAEAAAAELERQRLAQETAALEAERQRIAAENERLSEETATLREQVPTHPYRAQWATVASGGGLLLGSGIAALITNGRQNDLDSSCPNGVCPAGFDLEGAKDEVRRPAIATDVLLFTGIGAVTAGLVWYFVARGREDEAPAVSAGCSPTGCNLDVEVTF